MENKITLPGLSAILAQRSGLTKRSCEDFIRELFQLVASELAVGQIVKIKEIGTFRLTKVESRMSVDVATGEPIEIPGHNKVSFIPAKTLSEGINAPFEAFDAVEVPEGYSLEEDIEKLVASNEVGEEPEENEKLEVKSQKEGGECEEKEQPQEIYYEIEESKVSEELEPCPEPDPEQRQTACHKSNASSRFGWGFFIGFASCTIVFGVLGFIGYRTLLEKIETVAEPVIPAIIVDEDDSPAILIEEKKSHGEELPTISADTQPSDVKADAKAEAENAPVYDTISRTRYLTTMAKEHYGNYNLWPYIYEENKAILGHPDRIKPGTRVVIPSLKKYGVDPTSKTEIEKAREKGLAIYARFSNTQ